MKFIQRLTGDQIRAQYAYSKFYIKQFALLCVKSIFILSFAMIFFLLFFLILTPGPTEIKIKPIFEVKKSSDNSMITIFTNHQVKKSFCANQSATYFGKLYTKQQFCQFQHQNFPSQLSYHQQIDISLSGMNKNVVFITGCLVKINGDRSVCQKFAYHENIKTFNNLKFQDLYSIQIELQLNHGNEFFGQVEVLFQQENSFIVRILKEYYFIVSILASLFMAGLLTLSFVVFQIPEILEKGTEQEKKTKSQ